MNKIEANQAKIGDKVSVDNTIMTVVRITPTKVFVATSISSRWFSK